MVVLVSPWRPGQSLAIGQLTAFRLPCTTRDASGGGASVRNRSLQMHLEGLNTSICGMSMDRSVANLVMLDNLHARLLLLTCVDMRVQGPAVQVVRRHSRSADAFRYAPAMTTVSGNYVAARRMGVVDGVDFGLTGMARHAF